MDFCFGTQVCEAVFNPLCKKSTIEMCWVLKFIYVEKMLLWLVPLDMLTFCVKMGSLYGEVMDRRSQGQVSMTSV